MFSRRSISLLSFFMSSFAIIRTNILYKNKIQLSYTREKTIREIISINQRTKVSHQILKYPIRKQKLKCFLRDKTILSNKTYKLSEIDLSIYDKCRKSGLYLKQIDKLDFPLRKIIFS